MAKITERLAQIASDLAAGEPSPEPTTREFLSWVGAKRRGYWIVADLRRELARHRLVTQPDFESAYIDAPIRFQLVEAEGHSAPPVTPPDDDAGLPPDTHIDPTYRISKLQAANHEPVSVAPDATLETAVTLMMTNDFSQLPVMTTPRDVKGTITWRGIGSRLALRPKAAYVRDFMDHHVEVEATASLFEVINLVVANDYVLVRAPDRTISGIVTASDLSLQFRQLTEPFLLLGEIENHIRQLIGERYDVEELKEACDPASGTRDIAGVADLTFGEYIRLLQNEQRWAKLELAFDRKILVEKLDKIREIRNDVMHFDPDGIPDDDLEILRDFSRFLQRLQEIGIA